LLFNSTSVVFCQGSTASILGAGEMPVVSIITESTSTNSESKVWWEEVQRFSCCIGPKL